MTPETNKGCTKDCAVFGLTTAHSKECPLTTPPTEKGEKYNAKDLILGAACTCSDFKDFGSCSHINRPAPHTDIEGEHVWDDEEFGRATQRLLEIAEGKRSIAEWNDYMNIAGQAAERCRLRAYEYGRHVLSQNNHSTTIDDVMNEFEFESMQAHIDGLGIEYMNDWLTSKLTALVEGAEADGKRERDSELRETLKGFEHNNLPMLQRFLSILTPPEDISSDKN